MASTNGVLDFPLTTELAKSPSNLAAKRKRNSSVDIPNLVNGSSNSNSADAIEGREDNQAVVKDLIDVLKIHDSSTSILTRTLPDHISSVEHQAKRQRAEEGTNSSTTVLARVTSNTYKTVDEVLEDIDVAVADVLDKLQLPNSATRNQYIPVSLDKTEVALKVVAFKKKAHDLVRSEKAVREKQTIESLSQPQPNSSYVGNRGLGSNAVVQIDANSTNNRSVLTLCANAPGPKQLFSSLQKPRKASGEPYSVTQHLREAALPNGIYTSQIVPIETAGLVGDKKRSPTLGEVFPTPATVPSLQPPKPSKVSTTRSVSVGWYQPATADPSPKHGTYSRQTISTGQWLDYGSIAVTQGVKRKQRDRAMSLTGTKVPLTDVEGAEAEAAKLDALFRSAYSGFAPTKDNTAAMAPDSVMNRLWWQQSGERNFERLVENTIAVDEFDGSREHEDKTAINDEVDEVEVFRKAVEALEVDAIDPSLIPLEANSETSILEKDVEEILEGISDLIETLNSFQRNRHLTINPPSRAVGLLSSSETLSLGTPSKPSDQEQATYEILKSQLILLISTLPPYAVAKLNSDKLAELSISTRLEIQVEDYRGVMEEDDLAARAKGLALVATSSSRPAQGSSVHHRPTSSALYGNQYTPARPAVQPPQQYYGSNQTPIRPPSNNIPRPAASAPYASQRPAASSSYRPNTYATPTYAHQSVRPAQQSYPAGNSAQHPLQAAGTQNYPRQQSQAHQNSPQPTPQPYANPRYPGQTPYSTQGTANLNGGNYRYSNGANIARQASPQKPLYSPQIATAAQPSYSTPTPTPPIPQNRAYPQGPVMNGGSGQMAQSQTSPGLTPYSTFMTQEQQDSMMERQRAQLAQQQGAQQQARNAAQAGVMGSPSKVNGTSAVPVGL